MKQIVERYNPAKTYMYPNGALATPERVRADYPATELFTFVITTDESHQVIWSMDNLSALASIKGYKGTEDEIIAQYQNDLNNPPVPAEPAPDSNERIAAALEFQNLQAM